MCVAPAASLPLPRLRRSQTWPPLSSSPRPATERDLAASFTRDLAAETEWATSPARPLRPLRRASPLPSLAPSLSHAGSLSAPLVHHGQPSRELQVTSLCSIPMATTSSIPTLVWALQHLGSSARAPTRRRRFLWRLPTARPSGSERVAMASAGSARRPARHGSGRAAMAGPAPARCTPPAPIEAGGSIRTDCIREG